MLTPAEEAAVAALRQKTWLPIEEIRNPRKRFEPYEIGSIHSDSCELRHADGKLVIFLAIDRVSKFAYVEFCDSVGKQEGAASLIYPTTTWKASRLMLAFVIAYDFARHLKALRWQTPVRSSASLGQKPIKLQRKLPRQVDSS